MIKKYQIVNKDIVLTEDVYWTFEPYRKDSIRVWQLKDVDQNDIDIKSLEELIQYEEDVEIDSKKVGEKYVFTISCYLNQKRYTFRCGYVDVLERPFNEKELTKIILGYEQLSSKDSDKINSLIHKIDSLRTFLNKEIDRKTKLLNQLAEFPIIETKKVKIQLDILKQLSKKVNDRI